MRSIGLKLRWFVGWLEEGGFAKPLRWVLRILVSLGPVLFDFGAITVRGFKSWLWVAAWLLSLTALLILEHYKEESVLDRYGNKVAHVSGSFAGGLENLGSKLRGGLSEADCKHICVGFMARIKQWADILFPSDDDTLIRVTLAVPVNVDHNGTPEKLKVWCYDQPYANRKFSDLPMDHPGAPVAFTEASVSVITDITLEEAATDFHNRRFRSVLSIPVGGRAGALPCAVLNVDATKPNFFDVTNVTSVVMPILLPMIQAIGIAIHSRKKDATYAFNQ